MEMALEVFKKSVLMEDLTLEEKDSIHFKTSSIAICVADKIIEEYEITTLVQSLNVRKELVTQLADVLPFSVIMLKLAPNKQDVLKFLMDHKLDINFINLKNRWSQKNLDIRCCFFCLAFEFAEKRVQVCNTINRVFKFLFFHKKNYTPTIDTMRNIFTAKEKISNRGPRRGQVEAALYADCNSQDSCIAEEAGLAVAQEDMPVSVEELKEKYYSESYVRENLASIRNDLQSMKSSIASINKSICKFL